MTKQNILEKAAMAIVYGQGKEAEEAEKEERDYQNYYFEKKEAREYILNWLRELLDQGLVESHNFDSYTDKWGGTKYEWSKEVIKFINPPIPFLFKDINLGREDHDLILGYLDEKNNKWIGVDTTDNHSHRQGGSRRQFILADIDNYFNIVIDALAEKVK